MCAVKKQKIKKKQLKVTRNILHRETSAAVDNNNNPMIFLRWLGGVTVRASDVRSGGWGFDSWSGRYQAT